MKAKALERIWIDPATDLPKLSGHIDKNSVEYIRKDAFIEKAADWLNNFYNEDTHSYLIDEDIEKFINYMKGEISLNDDERWNPGCTDEWGTYHSCEGCPHNRYMGDGKPITATLKDYILR